MGNPRLVTAFSAAMLPVWIALSVSLSLAVYNLMGAEIIALVNLLLAGFFGIIVGGFCSAFFGQRWTLKVLLLDFLGALMIAVVAGFILAYALAFIGIYSSLVMPVWAIASLGVVCRHLWFRFKSHSN